MLPRTAAAPAFTASVPLGQKPQRCDEFATCKSRASAKRRRPTAVIEPLNKFAISFDPKTPTASGSFGEVFFGTLVSTQEPVVLKRPRKCPTSQTLFRVERAINKKLNFSDSPTHWPKYLGDYFCKSQTFLVWRRVGDGDTLDEFLFQRPHSALCDLLGVPSGVNGVNVSAFRSVVGGLLLALKEIHGRGIVHRDVKPANILLAAPRRGENPFKLIDFGSSADIRSLFWNRGVNTLDPLFAAPEQRLNVLGPEKFDVFSVGMIGAAVLLPQLASEARLREFRSALEAVDYDLRCVQGMENLQNEAADVWSLLCAMLKKSPGNRKSVNSALSDLGIL